MIEHLLFSPSRQSGKVLSSYIGRFGFILIVSAKKKYILNTNRVGRRGIQLGEILQGYSYAQEKTIILAHLKIKIINKEYLKILQEVRTEFEELGLTIVPS